MPTTPGRPAHRLMEDPGLHGLVIPVLGIPVSFEANEPAAITAVAEAFAAWRSVEHVSRLVSGSTAARMRIWIEDTPAPAAFEGGDDGEVLHHWPDQNRLIVRAGWSVGVADAARRDVVLFAERDRLLDGHAFRSGFLEPLVLAALYGTDRIPIRAAAVEYGDIALLLAGPPASGRSTLACAAAFAGFRILSDDRVHVQLEPRLRVWGMPGFIHLPVEAARFFPDIAVAAPRAGHGDRERIVLNVRELSALPALPVAQRAGVCIIVPSEGEPRIEPLDAEAVHALLLRTQTEDALSDAFAEPVRVLSRHGGWRLETGSDPAAAIELLKETLNELLGG